MQADNYCFACGCENPIGLRLHFEATPDGVIANLTPAREYQGFVNTLHGGIIATLLDEAMAHAVIAKGHLAVTARMELKFRKPVEIGQEISLKGQVLLEKGKLLKTSGEIEQNGEIKATALADFFIVDISKKK